LEWLSVFKVTTRERYDWITPIAMVCLGCIGFAFIYSAQYATQHLVIPTSISFLGVKFTPPTAILWVSAVLKFFWVKQIVFFILGLGVYVLISLIDYRFWLSFAHWVYLIFMVPLVIVLIPGLGVNNFGAQRWLDFGFFSYQPSETAKIAVLLIVASVLARSQIGTVKQSLGVLGKLALAVGIPMFAEL